MKKIISLCLAIFLAAADCLAAQNPKKAAPKKGKDLKAAAPAQVVIIPQQASADQEAKVKEQLNKKEWLITFIPIGSPKAKPHADTLNFYGSRVSSKRFGAKGFVESNYTLLMLPDGTFTWETTQKNEQGDVLFWKGELRGEMMSGVLSFHPQKGGNEDFSFTSSN